MKKYLLIGFILLSHRALSQALSSDGIDSIVENARKSFNVPGIAVAFLALGLLERDGLAVGVGILVAVLGFAIVTAASIGVVRALASF